MVTVALTPLIACACGMERFSAEGVGAVHARTGERGVVELEVEAIDDGCHAGHVTGQAFGDTGGGASIDRAGESDNTIVDVDVYPARIDPQCPPQHVLDDVVADGGVGSGQRTKDVGAGDDTEQAPVLSGDQ